MPRRLAHSLLLVAVLLSVAAPFALPPVPQDPKYHRFADRRAVLGIPNGLDVLSNLAFAAAGTFGLMAVARHGAHLDRARRRAYVALFAGTLLTAAGSAYYHLAPDNARLVWDRLPMTIGFMGLLAALLAERVHRNAARLLLEPLVILGAFSVFYWAWTEAHGAGDLRFYGVVQFGSLLVVMLVLVLYPAPLGGTSWLVAGLSLYALAKVFEAFDAAMFSATGVVSGHTLKHVSAGAGVALVAQMLCRRSGPVSMPAS